MVEREDGEVRAIVGFFKLISLVGSQQTWSNSGNKMKRLTGIRRTNKKLEIDHKHASLDPEYFTNTGIFTDRYKF